MQACTMCGDQFIATSQKMGGRGDLIQFVCTHCTCAVVRCVAEFIRMIILCAERCGMKAVYAVCMYEYVRGAL